jgi:drug/metabolite transporter (DMT)-like permease
VSAPSSAPSPSLERSVSLPQGEARGASSWKLQVGALQLAAALAAVYFIWGSTFLATRVALRELPPLFLAGIRFAIAGVAMYGWLRSRGVPAPTRAQWIGAAQVGVLLLVTGNGAMVFGMQKVG